MGHSEADNLIEQRRSIRHLLSPADPADALASYYALWHDPRRTQLAIHRDSQASVDGYVAVSQTGADLFRPLVTLRAKDEDAVPEMLSAALAANRPYRLIAPVTLASAVREALEISKASVDSVHRLDPSHFQPVINVLVQSVTGADGSARYQIESRGQLAAMAGTNWRSPSFAEVFVYVHPSGRSRGWGKSVVSACTSALLEERLRPLYVVQQDNPASVRIAESLGYVDTAVGQFAAEGWLRGSSLSSQ
jgi:RimJ/RimL family protein N-acetyltransferase